MKTKTFIEKDRYFTVTVKEDFYKKCPNPEMFNMYDLLNDHDIIKYLHNENGPALIDNTGKEHEYLYKYHWDKCHNGFWEKSFWLNGKWVKNE